MQNSNLSDITQNEVNTRKKVQVKVLFSELKTGRKHTSWNVAAITQSPKHEMQQGIIIRYYIRYNNNKDIFKR